MYICMYACAYIDVPALADTLLHVALRVALAFALRVALAFALRVALAFAHAPGILALAPLALAMALQLHALRKSLAPTLPVAFAEGVLLVPG